MPVKFICDGCGKEATGSGMRGAWYKPDDWYSRCDEDGPQIACSRDCIEIIAAKSGKTSFVLPV